MKILKYIPNTLTCLNLACGFVAIILSFNVRTFAMAGYLILAAAIFDFLDGFAARGLKAYSEIGKQLDSLADVISFGVAPGVLIFQLLQFTVMPWTISTFEKSFYIIPALIPVFSALRLAKFNIDTRQTSSFIGLPTPASAIFIASISIIMISTGVLEIRQLILNRAIIFTIIALDCFLMVSNLPMFSLKMKSLSLKENIDKYLFIALSILLIITFKMYSAPLIIILYVAMSVIFYLIRFFQRNSNLQ